MVDDVGWIGPLIVCGCNQEEDSDFNEVLSLIVRHSSIRVLVAFVALFDLCWIHSLFRM